LTACGRPPGTFLWPLLGWEFKRLEEYASFWQSLLGVYGHLGDIGNPHMLSLFIAELLGLAVITIFGAGHLRKKRKEQKINVKSVRFSWIGNVYRSRRAISFMSDRNFRSYRSGKLLSAVKKVIFLNKEMCSA
jgi:hypothetical protein